MRRPRPHDYDPKYAAKPLEEIDMDGVVPIRAKSSPPPHNSTTTIYTEETQQAGASDTASPTSVQHTAAPPASATVFQPATHLPTQQESNIAILQLRDDQIASLREPAYKAQTFRFTSSEIEWLKDMSYQMSKEMKRGKVSQADIIRVALQLFANAQATNQESLLDILQRIK
jgi:hypothetical protein